MFSKKTVKANPTFQYVATFSNGQTLTIETDRDPSDIVPNAIDLKTIGVAPNYKVRTK